MLKAGYVYILASQKHGTLYIGVTSSPEQRMYQHKHNMVEGFTSKYDVHHLVHIEEAPDMESAIMREKQLKNWHRQWKFNLIEEHNPEWRDLAADWFMDLETSSG